MSGNIYIYIAIVAITSYLIRVWCRSTGTHTTAAG